MNDIITDIIINNNQPRVFVIVIAVPDGKVHGANMGSNWVLLAPDGPHVGPINFALWGNITYAFSHLVSPASPLFVQMLIQANNKETMQYWLFVLRILC